MANEEQLAILRQGVDVWNKWREEKYGELVDLSGADLSKADLAYANLQNADLRHANLSNAKLWMSHLCDTNLRYANLVKADLRHADLRGAKLQGTTLIEANLQEANLQKADLSGSTLRKADLYKADLSSTNFYQAHLSSADLTDANLQDANLLNTLLDATNFMGADLTGAFICDAILRNTNLFQTKIENATISKCYVYGVNVWGLVGEFKEQEDLIITAPGESVITVDNIEIAQFIYLILNNQKIRRVLDTLTSKTVLILGRFKDPQRKAVLDALRNKLREFDLLPIVFDFERPTDQDFTETIKTLAGLCYFVIADVTNPKSSPLEMQATVPDYQIPFVPIIQEGEQPFSMMANLQTKYNWVLGTIAYDSVETLIEILKPHIIDPAIKKHDELRKIKASIPTVISGRELKENKR